MKALILTFLFTFSITTFAQQGAAKAIVVKGDVKAMIDNKVVKIKRGQWLPQGTQVKTENRSFAKLLFIDKSTMNVGPNSQMRIDSFPKSDAGIVTLVKGQIRSKVSKNYMDIKKKDKSKLFIKTKTAAMGVRGTDFQVSFNTQNQATSLVTFEGAVAMAKLDAAMANVKVNQNSLESVVSGQSAVMVRRGQYSGASPKEGRATIPVKISPVQLETLEKNEVPGQANETSSTDSKPKKKFRNVVPPGMDSKTVANDNSEVEKAVASEVGASKVQQVEAQVAQETGAVESAPPEGKIDVATGAIAPTAGGFIDLNTAQYVPPPEGSTYDANAGVFVPPADTGRVDPKTGNYVNDHYTLKPDGTFEAKPTQESGNSRGIASTNSSAPQKAPPPPPTVSAMPTMAEAMTPEVKEFAKSNGLKLPETNGGADQVAEIDTNVLDQAAENLNDAVEEISDQQNSDNNLRYGNSTSTTVNFRTTVSP